MKCDGIVTALLIATLVAGVPITADAQSDDPAGLTKVLALPVPTDPKPGELAIAVTYTLWIPPSLDARPLRGVIVHQHGCGEGAEKGGETATFDLHWRALAAKWDCALFGSSYRGGTNCASWFDPERGSARAFTQALATFGEQTGRPELARVPWVLWGHSGGAIWAYRMLEKFPHRVLAAVLRSGRPTRFEPGKPDEGEVNPVRDLTRAIPILCNLGLKERDDARFGAAWRASRTFSEQWRKEGALVAFTPDPRTGHECGNSRFVVIPFLDACLSRRLPAQAGTGTLRDMDLATAWLGDPDTGTIRPAAGEPPPNPAAWAWLPNEAVARVWKEFVTTGIVTDATAPEHAPAILKAEATADGVRLAWTAAPDFESGIKAFAVYRDGQALTTFNPQPRPRFAIAQFQQISYHDTPEAPVPTLSYLDSSAPKGRTVKYEIATINGFDRESPRSRAVEVRFGGTERRDRGAP